MLKAFKPCAKIGCPNVTHSRYCEDHQEDEQINKAIINKYYDMYARDKKSRQFYNSSEWKSVRDVVKTSVSNLCEMCLKDGEITIADVCDHIIPIKVDWSLRLEVSNLQMLCHRHHNEKTQRDKERYGSK